MYLSEKEAGRLMEILYDIRAESLREKQRRHRIANLTGKAALMLKKAERREKGTLNL